MPLLKIENLKKSYHHNNSETIVLSDLCLEVNEGELIAITGTSGCGKSTLLHIIGGVDAPDSGCIYLKDINVTQLNKKALASYRRKQVSLIYQFYNLIPVLNVLDNIILPLKLDCQPIDKEYLNALLETLQLSEQKYLYPSQLSGGQQQRVAIARSMITRPLLILADEPTGNLDKENSEIVMKQLHDLHQKCHTTIIMVTHDLQLAKQCDRIFFLDNGKVMPYENS